jgi:tetratricopeptide (TPR) repeat protein
MLAQGQHKAALQEPVVRVDMRRQIVSRLANLVKAQLTAAEARRAERAPNPGSIDLTFQGWAWWDKGITPDNLAEARRLFERALALDPADIWALVGIANADAVAAITFLPDDRAARLAAAEVALTKALSLSPDNAVAHLCQGIVQIHTNRASQGIREFERALELDRNLANAHAQIGAAKILLGQAEDAEAHIQEALHLSPRDTLVYLWCMFAGWAKFYLGKEEEAVAWLRRSIETNRNFPMSHFFLAAALALVGRLPEARSEVRAGLTMDPTFTISRIRASASSDNPAAIAGRERVIDGLRKAGVPEQ